jgi:hypothetical protein
MKATDFAFFLQGFFEIDGGTQALTKKQARQVLEKADSVVPGEGEAENKAAAFVAYTQGVLTTALDAGSVSETTTNRLRSKLNDLFIHAIDPTIPGDQEHLRKTHRPDPPDDNGPKLVAMC